MTQSLETQSTKSVQNQSAQKSVKDWLSSDQFKEAVKQSLPSHLTPERFIRVALTAIMKTPKLALCTQNSMFKAMLDLSSLGLEPDGRRAHLIPYENRKAGTVEVQLIIDYKGLIELSKRSGEVKLWRAEVVCENDGFEWQNGIVTHKIDWRKPRGKPSAVYSHVRNSRDEDDYEVMTFEQVEGIRKRSRAGQNGPWVTDYDEMAKKTVIRRHSKRLTLSPEFMEALVKDADQLEETTPSAEVAMPRRMSEQTPIESDLADATYDDLPNFNDPAASNESERSSPPPKKETPQVKIDPKAVISPVLVTELMKAMQESGITREELLGYLGKINLKRPQDIKNDQFEDVMIFVTNHIAREPGAEG